MWKRDKLCFTLLTVCINYVFYMILYKYYIPERVIVKNVTLRNMNINRGAAEVDIYNPKGDIFHYYPLRNVIFIYYTEYPCCCSLAAKSVPHGIHTGQLRHDVPNYRITSAIFLSDFSWWNSNSEVKTSMTSLFLNKNLKCGYAFS